jgi:hypothetical protein
MAEKPDIDSTKLVAVRRVGDRQGFPDLEYRYLGRAVLPTDDEG